MDDEQTFSLGYVQMTAITEQYGVSLEIGKFCTLSALFNQSRCVTD